MKIILWDFDGTLAYREGMWSGTLFSLLEKNNIKNITIEEIKPYLNNGFTWHTPEYSHKELFNGRTWWEYYEEYFKNIFIEIGLSDEVALKLSKQVKEEYINKTKWHLYDDVIKTLERMIENGYKNIILSNHVPELDQIVNNLNIKKYFYKIYNSAYIGYEKPNSKIFEYVVNDLKINKTDCIMVGDSYESDIKGALNVGINAIYVRKENKQGYRLYSKTIENIFAIIKNGYFA